MGAHFDDHGIVEPEMAGELFGFLRVPGKQPVPVHEIFRIFRLNGEESHLKAVHPAGGGRLYGV